MRTYHFLSEFVPFRKSYAMKFFFVALPVFLLAAGTLCWLIFRNSGAAYGRVPFFLLAVLVLLAFATIYMFHRLISPLCRARDALDQYVSTLELPDLPTDYADEAGVLLGHIQATLTQMNALLVEKNDMIDLLSHDLRSPVGRISSISAMIKTDPENRDLYADYISNECKGLIRMLENLLLMLKEESSSLNVVNVNLKRLVQETVSFFDFAAAEKSLEMKIFVDDSIYLNVQPELFIQALRNIIGNAIKFSPDGKTISVAGTQDEEKILLRIRDEGLGFMESDIQKIFDRFTSAGKKGTRGETSTGLGLYLSKKIVEKHGGKLIAESEGINRGACFTIMLYRLVTKKNKGRVFEAGREGYTKPVVLGMATM